MSIYCRTWEHCRTGGLLGGNGSVSSLLAGFFLLCAGLPVFADYKLYTAPDGAFSFSYPDSFVIEEENDKLISLKCQRVVFGVKREDSLMTFNAADPEKLEEALAVRLTQYLDEFKKEPFKLIESSAVRICGIPAKKVIVAYTEDGKNFKMEIVFCYWNSKWFEMAYGGLLNDFSTYNATFHGMAQSIKIGDAGRKEPQARNETAAAPAARENPEPVQKPTDSEPNTSSAERARSEGRSSTPPTGQYKLFTALDGSFSFSYPDTFAVKSQTSTFAELVNNGGRSCRIVAEKNTNPNFPAEEADLEFIRHPEKLIYNAAAHNYQFIRCKPHDCNKGTRARWFEFEGVGANGKEELIAIVYCSGSVFYTLSYAYSMKDFSSDNVMGFTHIQKTFDFPTAAGVSPANAQQTMPGAAQSRPNTASSQEASAITAAIIVLIVGSFGLILFFLLIARPGEKSMNTASASSTPDSSSPKSLGLAINEDLKRQQPDQQPESSGSIRDLCKAGVTGESQMDQGLVRSIRRTMAKKPTEKLIRIYSEHNTNFWSKEAFEAIYQVLVERGEPVAPYSLETSEHRESVQEEPMNTTSAASIPGGSAVLVVIKCPHCNEGYRFRPENVGTGRECRRCGKYFVAAATDANDQQSWYFSLNGVAYGPVTKGDLESRLNQGQLFPTTLVCSDSVPQWAEAQTVNTLHFTKRFVPPPLPNQTQAPVAVAPAGGLQSQPPSMPSRPISPPPAVPGTPTSAAPIQPAAPPQPPQSLPTPPGAGSPQWPAPPGYYPPPPINIPEKIGINGTVIVKPQRASGRLKKVWGSVIFVLAIGAIGFGAFLQSQGNRSSAEDLFKVGAFFLVPAIILFIWGSISEYINAPN